MDPRSQDLILVDDKDVVIGHANREECHAGPGQQHRAFSVLLFDDQGRLLLQRRSMQKSLWPGFWSNSCCSHPKRGEEAEPAAVRRVSEELGLSCSLRFIYKFGYHARFSDVGSERELCWVFFGRLAGEPRPDPAEVMETRLERVDTLGALIRRSPDEFTPWFKLAWSTICEDHMDRVRELTS